VERKGKGTKKEKEGERGGYDLAKSFVYTGEKNEQGEGVPRGGGKRGGEAMGSASIMSVLLYKQGGGGGGGGGGGKGSLKGKERKRRA